MIQWLANLFKRRQPLTPEQETWITALESGNYKQGFGVLHQISDNSFCVLGVACDLFKKEAPTKCLNFYQYELEYKFLPDRIHKLLKLTRRSQLLLAKLNDRGSSLSALAKELRTHPDKYFEE